MNKIVRWWWKVKRKISPRRADMVDRESYLRLLSYIEELMRTYKEVMEFLLERLKGRKEYWEGQTAGLRMKAPDKNLLLELEVAQARLEELGRFLGWVETVSTTLSKKVIEISDNVEEEIKRLFPK